MFFHGATRRAFVTTMFVMSFGFMSIASAQTSPPTFIEGSLVQAKENPRVYYIQNGQKRPIISEAVFLAQGFRWSDITLVDQQRLTSYPEGSDLTDIAFLGLPVDRSLLPDLAPAAPYDLRFAVEEGRLRLRFTATFVNRGKGALELNADAGSVTTGDGAFDASQRIFRPDGTSIDRPVGTLFWHEIHGHYHYDDFGRYVLEMVRPAPGAQLITPLATLKTTFCMRDDLSIGAPVDGVLQARKYTGCRGHKQGVSVGWADVYAHSLSDQYVDVTSLPAGIYKLSFVVDSTNFIESRRDNNISSTFFELDPAGRVLKIIATASPYESPNNRYPDGMLIRAEGDSKVYVMRANKKRWLRTEQAFLSYGYSWESIFVLPAGAVAVIPQEELVRVAETGTVFALNVAGYKRRILNPEVLSSYGWTGIATAEISQAEFDATPSTDLIMPSGDSRVYSIGTKKFVGTMDILQGLGLDRSSVHIVNQTDFNAYATQVVAKGLTVPWDIVFLPDGDMLVTERSGTIRRIGKRSATIALPSVLHTGEGGLMGIALHPNFTANSFIYLYYTTTENGQKNQVMRFKLDGDRLLEDKLIVDDIPSALYHDGGQLAFGADGMLYLTTGDAETPALAQNLSSLAGKTLRFTPEGQIPNDNPFGTAVWSYGHRNAQGIAWDDQGRMWQTEHGRSGALSGLDELNLIVKGGNYGWPQSQGDIVAVGTVGPVRHSGAAETWAPSGIAAANGKLFFAGLRGSTLYEVLLGPRSEITGFRKHFKDKFGRLRAVVLGPDGFLYVTTSNRDGRGTPRPGDDIVLRIHPDFLR